VTLIKASIWVAILLAGGWAFPKNGVEAQLIYGPETEHFYVRGSQITSDGRTGLFTFNHVFQRRAQPESLVSGETYRVATRGIGAYDLESGRITIVHRSPGTSGTGRGAKAAGYNISGLCWNKVLVSSSDANVQPGKEARPEQYWLDLGTRSLTRAPLHEEWAAKGIEVTHYWVIDAKGTIAIWARRRRAASDPAHDPSQSRHLWVRSPSGRYDDVGLFFGILMTDDKQFLFRSPIVLPHAVGGEAGGGHYVLYNIETRKSRTLSYLDGFDLGQKMGGRYPSHRSDWCAGAKRDAYFSPARTAGGGSIPPLRFELSRLGDRGWESHPITLPVEDLKAALGL
jgi:hypothetical protein